MPKKANIIEMNIADLNRADYNPRVRLKPGMKDYDSLKRSITEFGYVDPIIWNEQTGNIVGGHQRLDVLTELGYEKVDVSVVDLDENKEKALNIALNKIAGDWEHDKLGEILNELKDVEFDADELLKLTGFTDKELDNYITEDDLTGGKGTGLDDEDEGFNYKIMVECTDEMDQIRIIELLEEEDITCRPLVS